MSTTSERMPRYSMMIEWSDLDGVYIVSLPEWERVGAMAHAHGVTYAEAAAKGEELISFLLHSALNDGENIPTPAGFDARAYAPGETSESIETEIEALTSEIESHLATSA